MAGTSPAMTKEQVAFNTFPDTPVNYPDCLNERQPRHGHRAPVHTPVWVMNLVLK